MLYEPFKYKLKFFPCDIISILSISPLFIDNVTALFAFIPVAFYNGTRGLRVKWLFYIFYPAHLLLLYMVSCVMGLGEIPVV